MNRLKKILRLLGKGIKWLLFVLLGLLLISGLYNLTLPESSSITNKMASSQKAYLAEYMHLQDQLTDSIWTGFGDEKIPVIVYNEQYAFLVGIEQPEVGWYKMPSKEHRGGPWVKVNNDQFLGMTYYRQPLPDKNKTPENFAVLVGKTWVSTMQTREYAEVAFYDGFRDELPPVINWVFPYKIFWNLVMGDAENYISGLIHEAFHAYQGISIPEKFTKAESVTRLSSEYPWESNENQKGWSREADLLLQAYKSESTDSMNHYISKFLNQRDQRRTSANISSQLIEYEQNREWLEGLAKYVELKIGIVALEANHYESVAKIKELSDFKHYQNSTNYLEQQISEVSRRVSSNGESRFYYMGMLQAILLDRIAPRWKNEIFKENVYLEDLLKSSVKTNQQISEY